MSASLVGSEMCIRDRHWRRRAKRGALSAKLRFPRGRRLLRSSGLGEGPVSYTHLTLPTICSV
eukprot:5313171-Alexandrium_andersonii.AAC.1